MIQKSRRTPLLHGRGIRRLPVLLRYAALRCAHRAVRAPGRYAISPSVSANTLGPQSAKYAERFLYVCNYINEHCTEDLSLETIAGIAGFSKYHFTRLFKDFTHTSFYRYLNKKRISHAEQLLINPKYSVTEVALQSGFSSLSAFIRMFKQLKGCTPTEFKRMYSLDCMNRVDGDSAPDTLSGK
ncbi:AraC family transcriptional regulator [Hungatella hathewayi]|nr:AraC family transcriptional regulator [Hungatella hathewayi]